MFLRDFSKCHVCHGAGSTLVPCGELKTLPLCREMAWHTERYPSVSASFQTRSEEDSVDDQRVKNARTHARSRRSVCASAGRSAIDVEVARLTPIPRSIGGESSN